MKYENVEKGIFISRPNRFIANVEICGREERVHVKNTGRCRELLPEGAEVYLSHSCKSTRKTTYDLVAVKKGNRIINMDSQAPNKAFYEWAVEGNFIDSPDLIKPGFKWGNSRFDFYIEKGDRRCLVEVKGVTLEFDGKCYFPDAPTERGVKHLMELTAALESGYDTYIIFIVQMKDVMFLSPNDDTHPAFGEALRLAQNRGVNILAYDCYVEPGIMEIRDKIPVKL